MATILLSTSRVLPLAYSLVSFRSNLGVGGMIFTPVGMVLATIVVILRRRSVLVIVVRLPQGSMTALVARLPAMLVSLGRLSAVILSLVVVSSLLERLRQ